jgi:hypothetical protein
VTVEPENTPQILLDSRLSKSDLTKFVKQGRDGFYSGIVKEYGPDDPALDASRIRDVMIANVKLFTPSTISWLGVLSKRKKRSQDHQESIYALTGPTVSALHSATPLACSDSVHALTVMVTASCRVRTPCKA